MLKQILAYPKIDQDTTAEVAGCKIFLSFKWYSNPLRKIQTPYSSHICMWTHAYPGRRASTVSTHQPRKALEVHLLAL